MNISKRLLIVLIFASGILWLGLYRSSLTPAQSASFVIMVAWWAIHRIGTQRLAELPALIKVRV